MGQRPAIVFLIKIVPVFAVLLVAWHTLGLSRAYHSLIAFVMSAVYAPVDPAGVVHSFRLDGRDFVVRLIVETKRSALHVNAADITSNLVMLLALYLASPFRRRIRSYMAFLAGSLATLFVVHCITLATVIQEAFMGHQAIMRSAPFSAIDKKLVPRYNVFYEEMGMYLVVLALWLPYIALRLRDRARQDAPREAPDKENGSRPNGHREPIPDDDR